MRVIVCFAFCLLFSFPALALEADQYRIWKGIRLKESLPAVNQTINQNLDEFLKQSINRRGRVVKSCESVAIKFYSYIRPNILINRFKRDLFQNHKVDLHPKKKRLFVDFQDSIFAGFAWPFIMPVAQTLKVNGVYIGSDKLDHFFSSGRRYYKVYVRTLKRSHSEQEALKKAVNYGLSPTEEKGVLGMWSAASFSFADLEANYQGMQLGRDLCDPKDPILIHSKDSGWVKTRDINMAAYVNPLWDEAFNNSHYAKFRWASVKEVLQQQYCQLGQSRFVKNLWRGYQRRLRDSFHTDYLRGLMIVEKVPNPKEQSIARVCGYEDKVMQGVPFWWVPGGDY